LIDLEFQRMELIKFNLFDNATFKTYLMGDGSGRDGATVRVWKERRLLADHPNFRDLAIDADDSQRGKGELSGFRPVSDICNDSRNPAMGSTGQWSARNVECESTFPDLGQDELAKNRHGGRISLLQPDPQVISRKLFTRDQSAAPDCNQGHGTADQKGDCAYQ